MAGNASIAAGRMMASAALPRGAADSMHDPRFLPAQQLYHQQSHGLHPGYSAPPGGTGIPNEQIQSSYATVNALGQPVQAPVARSIGQQIPMLRTGMSNSTLFPHHVAATQSIPSPLVLRQPPNNSSVELQQRPPFYRKVSAVPLHSQLSPQGRPLPVQAGLSQYSTNQLPHQPPPLPLHPLAPRTFLPTHSGSFNTTQSSQSTQAGSLPVSRQPSLSDNISADPLKYAAAASFPTSHIASAQPPQHILQRGRQQESPVSMDGSLSMAMKSRSPILFAPMMLAVYVLY